MKSLKNIPESLKTMTDSVQLRPLLWKFLITWAMFWFVLINTSAPPHWFRQKECPKLIKSLFVNVAPDKEACQKSVGFPLIIILEKRLFYMAILGRFSYVWVMQKNW